MSNGIFKELETENLILRKILPSDAEDLYNNIYNDFDWYKYYYQVKISDFNAYKVLIATYEEQYKSETYYRWGIVNKKDNKMIGIIQFHSKDLTSNNCRIGYIISYKYCNQGLMTEACKSIIDFAFNEIGFHRIEATIVEDNIASIKLAEAIGMKYEGTRIDSYKLEDKYYNQKNYSIINRKEEK